RDFRPLSDAPEFVCQGKVRIHNRSILGDIVATLREVGPLSRWAKAHRPLVFHAHSRMGICAGSIVHWLTGVPLVINLHTLARHPWVYRILRRLTHSSVVYNSRKTCFHFGDNPANALIQTPGIQWPEKPPPQRDGKLRFVAAGAMVRGKHFHVILSA